MILKRFLRLRKYCNLDSASITRKLELNKKQYLPIKKAVIPEDLNSIIAEASKIKGLNIDRYNQRFYPYEQICSHIVGYTNSNGDGRSGIELQYNKLLSGAIEADDFSKSLNERWQEQRKERFNHKLNGKDIYLTIDIRLQNIFMKHSKRTRKFISKIGEWNNCQPYKW